MASCLSNVWYHKDTRFAFNVTETLTADMATIRTQRQQRHDYHRRRRHSVTTLLVFFIVMVLGQASICLHSTKSIIDWITSTAYPDSHTPTSACPESIFPVPVMLWPPTMFGSEVQHFFLDGVEQSKAMIQVKSVPELQNLSQSQRRCILVANAWVGGYWSGERWCSAFLKHLQQIHQSTFDLMMVRVFILDWSDDPNKILRCPKIEDYLLRNMVDTSNSTMSIDSGREELVVYGKRSIEQDRYYDDRSAWIMTGRVLKNVVPAIGNKKTRNGHQHDTNDNNNSTVNWTSPIFLRHLNYPVRTDVIHTTSEVLESTFNISCSAEIAKNNETIQSNTCDDDDDDDYKQRRLFINVDIAGHPNIDRVWDVAHFWNATLPATSELQQMGPPALFRQRVSRALSEWVQQRTPQYGRIINTVAGTTVNDIKTNKPIHAFIGIAGHSGESGRSSVQRQYIETMLQSKIIVVVQRDGWTDHYRLMEALAVSGALVMTDKMGNGLPSGLEDGRSIVVFESKQDLIQKLEYYLEHDDERVAIARRGRTIVLTRHRSWHRMEEVVFGSIMTP